METNKQERRSQIVKHFRTLIRASEYYVAADNNEKRIRIYNACDGVFASLEELGIDRTYSEALLTHGEEFLESVQGVNTITNESQFERLIKAWS